jgi:hypothetical protein
MTLQVMEGASLTVADGGRILVYDGGKLFADGNVAADTIEIFTGGSAEFNSPLTDVDTLIMGDGTEASAVSIQVDTLTIGIGSKLTIKAITSGSASLTKVPEPGAIVLLAIAALFIGGFSLRIKK